MDTTPVGRKAAKIAAPLTTTTPHAQLSKKYSPITQIRRYGRSSSVLTSFTALLGGDQYKAKGYVETVLTQVIYNEKLQECSPRDIFTEAQRAAALGLSVEPSLQQAYLAAKHGKVTMIVDYRGLVMLSENTGYYEIAPDVQAIYEGEIVQKERWGGRITITGEPTSETIIGWCAYFKAINGTERWEYMTNIEADAWAIKHNPEGYSEDDGAWKKAPDAMRRKTVLRTLLRKWGRFSPYATVILNKSTPINPDVPLPDENIIDNEPEPVKYTIDEINSQLGFD